MYHTLLSAFVRALGALYKFLLIDMRSLICDLIG